MKDDAHKSKNSDGQVCATPNGWHEADPGTSRGYFEHTNMNTEKLAKLQALSAEVRIGGKVRLFSL